MGYAGSIFVIAIGAILRYATNAHVEGISIDTVGLILMIAGAAALVLSLFMDFVWADRMRRRDAVIDERREVPPREVPPREAPPRY